MKRFKAICCVWSWRFWLAFLVDAEHALVQLAREIDWSFFERELSVAFHESTGAPANPVRLMVGLHYLKQTYNLSDEQTVERWVENPYWQYFCGMKWFEYTMPIDPSSMTRWRKLIGERGAEAMLAQSIATGLRLKTQALRESSFEQINVDTTVQEKAVGFPTDAQLYSTMRQQLVRLANEHGVQLRQSYARVGRRALIMVGRYGRARQGKRRARETRRLRTYALYSREALAAELKGIIDIETFLLRVQPKKRFKRAYWGQDLIDGMNSSTLIGDEKPHRINESFMQVKPRKCDRPSSGLGRLHPKDYRNLR